MNQDARVNRSIYSASIIDRDNVGSDASEKEQMYRIIGQFVLAATQETTEW